MKKKKKFKRLLSLFFTFLLAKLCTDLILASGNLHTNKVNEIAQAQVENDLEPLDIEFDSTNEVNEVEEVATKEIVEIKPTVPPPIKVNPVRKNIVYKRVLTLALKSIPQSALQELPQAVATTNEAQEVKQEEKAESNQTKAPETIQSWIDN